MHMHKHTTKKVTVPTKHTTKKNGGPPPLKSRLFRPVAPEKVDFFAPSPPEKWTLPNAKRNPSNQCEKKSKRPSQKELIKKSWAHPKEVQATKIENKFKQPSREGARATNAKGSPSAHPKRS